MTATMRKILKVTFHRDVDTDADLSHLGKYSNRPGADDVTIDRKERGDCRRHEYPFFIAAMSGKQTGNSESVEQDYKRMEDYNAEQWCMVGVYATAEVKLAGDTVQTIRSGGLWGVESDSDSKYFDELREEQLNELHDQLVAVGFTSEDIHAAFDDCEDAD